MEHQMTGAELASMLKGQLKGNMKFNGIIGVDDPELHLSETDIKWWRDAKFGMFIHWGVYSFLGRGEWVYFNEGYKEEEYRKIAEAKFHPVRSAGEIVGEWTDYALQAGMKYAVMVTRHHDGYALWDSNCSYKDFTSVRCGSGEDYVKAFTNACHEKNLYTGLYYSPMDWRFPGYFAPKEKIDNALLMKQQAYGQIRELCSRYGKVDILWYDGGWLAHTGNDADAAWFWEPIKMNKMVRSYNDKTMVTPRSGYKGDFECDEGSHEVKGKIVPVPWEKCMSLTTTWGYVKDDTVKTFEFMIPMFVNTICRDGNLLLNVGPDLDGRIPGSVKDVLAKMGRWLEENGEAVYGTRAGIWQPVDGVYGSTYKDDNVYVHILDCERFSKEILPLPEKEIEKAMLLDGNELVCESVGNGLRIIIPEKVMEEKRLDTIVKVVLKGSDYERVL